MRWFAGFVTLNIAQINFAYATVWMTGMFGDVGLSTDGWIALCLGTTFASALGIGLMALVFYSDREGVDDLAGLTAEAQK